MTQCEYNSLLSSMNFDDSEASTNMDFKTQQRQSVSAVFFYMLPVINETVGKMRANQKVKYRVLLSHANH